jgi:hypothetical protein
VFGSAVSITTALLSLMAFPMGSGNRQALVRQGRGLAYFVGVGIAENLSNSSGCPAGGALPIMRSSGGPSYMTTFHHL